MRPPDNVSPKAWKKLMKLVSDSFMADLEGMDADALLDVIAQSERNIRDEEHARDNDEALAAAKATASDLGAAYRDAIAAQRAKQRLATFMLESKGQ